MIEILVVLAILAILMTIVFVSLGNQRQRARLAGATSSVKSAMTLAATCYTMGGTVNSPPTDSQTGNSIAVCGDSQTVGSSVWPDLPQRCYYCGMSGTQVFFECMASSCDGASQKSFCDIGTTQCVQNN